MRRRWFTVARTLYLDGHPIPYQPRKSHCLDTHGKRSHPFLSVSPRLPHSHNKSPELLAGENVKYLEQEETHHSLVSSEHPYQRRSGHKEGKDLRYGGLERYKREVKDN
jgi:hypothetical protein